MAKSPEEYKMWLAVRSDLNMPAGKMAVQSGHAFQLLAVQVYKDLPVLYGKYTDNQSIVKIAVEAVDENHLLRINEAAKNEGIPSILIKDSGRTIFNEPTFTVCAFGPALRSELPPFLKRLQLYGDKIEKSVTPV